MYSMVKRVSVFALALLTLVMGVVVPAKRATAATLYNNTSSANLTVNIDSNGKLFAYLSVVGINGQTKKIEVSLYVEKKILGLFWSRVDIDNDDDTWYDSSTSYYYSNTFSHNFSSTGTYRVTVTYTVSGTGGPNDVITKTATATY